MNLEDLDNLDSMEVGASVPTSTPQQHQDLIGSVINYLIYKVSCTELSKDDKEGLEFLLVDLENELKEIERMCEENKRQTLDDQFMEKIGARKLEVRKPSNKINTYLYIHSK